MTMGPFICFLVSSVHGLGWVFFVIPRTSGSWWTLADVESERELGYRRAPRGYFSGLGLTLLYLALAEPAIRLAIYLTGSDRTILAPIWLMGLVTGTLLALLLCKRRRKRLMAEKGYEECFDPDRLPRIERDPPKSSG